MSDFPPPPPSPPAGIPHGYQPYRAAAQVSYAGWGTRVGANLLRALPSFVVFLPVWLVMLTTTTVTTSNNADGFARMQLSGPGVVALLIAVVAYVMVLGVQVRMMIQRAHLGYDFADAAVSQRLVMDDSHQPLGSGWSVFGRGLLHIVDALPCYVGFLAPLWTAKKQTFADSIMKTVVVQSSPQHMPKDLFVNSLTLWKPVLKR